MPQQASRVHSYYRHRSLLLTLDLSDHIFIPHFYSDANKTLKPYRLILISSTKASIKASHILGYRNWVSTRINLFLPRLSKNIYLHKLFLGQTLCRPSLATQHMLVQSFLFFFLGTNTALLLLLSILCLVLSMCCGDVTILSKQTINIY